MEKTQKRKYTRVRLEDIDGEYSADPSDYFNATDNHVFDGRDLTGEEYKKGGWHRRVIIKENPTKADLKKYYDG